MYSLFGFIVLFIICFYLFSSFASSLFFCVWSSSFVGQVVNPLVSSFYVSSCLISFSVFIICFHLVYSFFHSSCWVHCLFHFVFSLILLFKGPWVLLQFHRLAFIVFITFGSLETVLCGTFNKFVLLFLVPSSK